MNRQITPKIEKIVRDSNFIAHLLDHSIIGVGDFVIATYRDLSCAASQIVTSSYNGIDLVSIVSKISGRDKIEDDELTSLGTGLLDQTPLLKRLLVESVDYSRRLHHSWTATAHLPYAIARVLNQYEEHAEPQSRDLFKVFSEESSRFPSGLTSEGYLHIATCRWLMNKGYPVFGNVAAGVKESPDPLIHL